MDFSDRVRRAQQGDREALEQLFAEWRPWLRQQAERVAWAEKSARFDASDVVQLTLVEAFQNLDQFRGYLPGEFSNWLFRILRCQAAQQYRYHSAACRKVKLEYRNDRSFGELRFVPRRQALHTERHRRLETALQRLPEPLRDVVVGRVFQGRSFNSLARRLNRSPRIVRRQWAEALRHLADALRGLTSSSESCAL